MATIEPFLRTGDPVAVKLADGSIVTGTLIGFADHGREVTITDPKGNRRGKGAMYRDYEFVKKRPAPKGQNLDS